MTDVLIIGGGIAGVSAAAALSEGASVTLLEAEPALGYHASGRSAAMFVENYGNAVVRALNRASRAALEAAGVLSPRGIYLVGLGGEEERFHESTASLGMRPVPLPEARARVPILSPGVTLVAESEDGLDIDTDRLLQGYVRQARENGARIVTGTPVTAVSRAGRGWRVDAGGESYRAGALVNAAGPWADRIAGMAGAAPLGLVAFRRSMARLPAPGDHDVTGWPMLLGTGESWYAKPDAGGWIVSPAEEDPVEPQDAWADDLVLAEGLARYEAHVSEPVTRVQTTWAGLRTFAPDRSLVIGEGPAPPGFFWLAGQGGYGFQTAPAAAALLSDLVLGRAPRLDAEVVRALSPGRFA